MKYAMQWKGRPVLAWVFGLSVALAAAPSFAATTWTVTNTNDGGAGSLRATIANAAPGDTLVFALPNSSTITLTSGELLIDKNLTISSLAPTQLAISGNNASRVFEISGGMTVTVSGLTMKNGNAGSGGGGAVYNQGTLTLANCIVSGSTGLDGGGIVNSGTLTLTNSTVSANTAGADGGGIDNLGTLTLTGSTVSGNTAQAFAGGGILNNATLTLTRSTISGNTGNEGGGLNNGGTATVTNSTITGNTGKAIDGGIENQGVLTVTNSTIALNTAKSGAGGIDNLGTLTLNATLLASNGLGGNCLAYSGTITSKGYNLSDDHTCAAALTQSGDENNVVAGAGLDPKGLQNNGGPTQTIALQATSPAVDHIPTAACAVTTDQRGVNRPQGSACDVGAFELNSSSGSGSGGSGGSGGGHIIN